MSTTAQHTAGISPLPWKVEERVIDGFGGDELARYIQDSKGEWFIHDVSRENAEYIVKACNLFPGLVEALESLLVWADVVIASDSAEQPFSKSVAQKARDILVRVKDENFGQASPSLVP